MKAWTMLMGLVVACLVAANASAQGTSQTPTKKHTLQQRFQKMDTNGDGILTEEEFAAAHSKLGNKAAGAYKELTTLGGTTTKDGATGMTFQQFKKALQQFKKSHPGKKQSAS